MSGTVSPLNAVPQANHGAVIADALERLADDIRAGRQFPPTRCIVVLARRASRDADDFAVGYYGGELGIIELVGLMELAKQELVAADE